MKILAISDEEIGYLAQNIRNGEKRFENIDIMLSCGDLPENYVRTIAESVSRPYLYILGNHDPEKKQLKRVNKKKYIGFKYKRYCKTLFLGFSGSEKYNETGVNQFDQITTLVQVIGLIFYYFFTLKFLFYKRMIVISHNTPNFNIKDEKNHRGFWAYNLIIFILRPDLWIHGHIHLKSSYEDKMYKIGKTKIVNIYGYKIIEINHKKISIKN